MPRVLETTQQRQFGQLADLMISGVDRKSSAIKLGRSESTLDRWLRDPQYREIFRQRRQAVADIVIGKAAAGLMESIDALRRNLSCGNPQVETRAAAALAEIALKVEESYDFQTRLAELEKVVT